MKFDPEKDNEAVYDEKLAPLMSQIIAICKEHDIPMVASFQFAEDGLCTTFLLPEGCGQNLVDAARAIRPPSPIIAMTITSAAAGPPPGAKP